MAPGKEPRDPLWGSLIAAVRSGRSGVVNDRYSLTDHSGFEGRVDPKAWASNKEVVRDGTVAVAAAVVLIQRRPLVTTLE
jgi:hypothetical protein